MEADDIRELWLEEARADAKLNNPLIGYCQRVYFQRTSCKLRNGPHKGKRRGRKTLEVELLRFLPSRRCVVIKDLDTKGLDALAEEIFSDKNIPPDTNPAQLFLNYFRQL